MNATIDQAAQVEAGPYRVFVGAFTALRIFTGLVWLSNGLAKLIDKGGYDWGFISFNLVTRGSAQSIANDASKKTYIAPLGAFYQNVVLPRTGGSSGPSLTSPSSRSGSGCCSGSRPGWPPSAVCC